jgi:Ni,Fe-hydrogenase III large subunit
MQDNFSEKRTITPFGPQHPVLPEPLQLKLVLEDEKVVEAVPGIGYVHRGLEKLGENRDYMQTVYVVERVCGICSIMHAQAYCQGIEELLGVEIPDRAKFLRVIWAELHRMHSHLLYLGLMADAFGFEALFMQTWRIRERILDLLEQTTGHRIMVSVNTVGGTSRDLTPEMLTHILSELDEMRKDFDEIAKTFDSNITIAKRLHGVGVLDRDKAYQLGCVGPVARACGLGQDMRMLGYAAYDRLDFEPVVLTDGDAFARTQVRIKEIYQSMDLVRQAIGKLPEGEHLVKVTGNPDGDVISRVEQPRGEVYYFMRGDGGKNLRRLRLRTPTFAHLASLVEMLPGSSLADVPVIIVSIDPCISCTER